MGKEEIGKQIDSKKFSKTMRCYGDDKLVNITVRQSRQSGVARATCPD